MRFASCSQVWEPPIILSLKLNASPSAQHMFTRCLLCTRLHNAFPQLNTCLHDAYHVHTCTVPAMGQSLSLAVRGTKTSCHPSAHHLGEDASVLTSSFPFQKLLLHFLPRLCIRAPSSPAFDQFFPLTKSLRSSTSLLLLGSLRLCLQVNGILISIPSAEKCL